MIGLDSEVEKLSVVKGFGSAKVALRSGAKLLEIRIGSTGSTSVVGLEEAKGNIVL